MVEATERTIKRHRWVGFVNGFSSGIGFATFLIVIFIWLTSRGVPQVASLVGFVILAIIAGLSIFLVSITVEIYHQARMSQPIPISLEQIPAEKKLCSKCGSEMKYIPRLSKFYCENCKSYE